MLRRHADRRRWPAGMPRASRGSSVTSTLLRAPTQGLASGGTRRSFPGCQISAPTETGPVGVSACRINASDNSGQGALMAAFYYDWRVVDGDPYRVVVVS